MKKLLNGLLLLTIPIVSAQLEEDLPRLRILTIVSIAIITFVLYWFYFHKKK